MNDTTDRIKPLSGEQWQQTQKKAEALIRAKIKRPMRTDYKGKPSRYPPSVLWGGIVLLIIVALAAFIISAGRQVAAFNVISASLATDYGDLISQPYIKLVLIAALALSEFAVILFGLGAHVLATSPTSAKVLRGFQIISIAIAMGGNLTVFARSIQTTWGAAQFFDLLVTLAAPAIVIGVGVLIEELAYESVGKRHQDEQDYQSALAAYKETIAEPDKHEEWMKVWSGLVFEVLTDNLENKAIIDWLIDSDERWYDAILYAEWSRHKRNFNPDKAPEPLPIPEPPPEPVKPSNVKSDKVDSDVDKTPGKKELRVIEWLNANPDRSVKMSSREIAAELGDISHQTVNGVRNRQVTSNGNGNHHETA